MRDVEELDLERAELDDVLRLDRVKLRLVEQPMLLELVLHQTHREAAAVHRNIQIGKDERQRADMVFVAVGEEDGFDFALVFEKVADVGNDDVDAEQFVVRKHDAGIDDDDGAVAAERHHVHSKFAESAERNDIECLIRHLELIIHTKKLLDGERFRPRVA